jgi:hypothetical protein
MVLKTSKMQAGTIPTLLTFVTPVRDAIVKENPVKSGFLQITLKIHCTWTIYLYIKYLRNVFKTLRSVNKTKQKAGINSCITILSKVCAARVSKKMLYLAQVGSDQEMAEKKMP